LAAGRYDNESFFGPLTIADWQQYEHNLNIVAQVMETGYSRVIAMNSKGELRGQALIEELSGKQYAFLTVFGQGNKQERIKLYLAGKDGVSATTTAFAFAADQVMGTLADPLLLESASIDVAVYPNAFTDKLNIELSAYTGQEAAISLTDALGRVRMLDSVPLAKGWNKLELRPQVPKGLYVLTIVVDGQRQTIKVVKK